MRIILISVLVMISFSAFAADKFRGYIGFGAGYISTDDNMSVSADNRDQTVNIFSKTLPIVTGELKYETGDMVFHIGRPLDSPDPAFSAGITKKFSEDSSLDISAKYIAGNAWENPYLERRTETGEAISGLTARYEGIGGSFLFAEASVLRHDIKDDDAGDAYDTLSRDGIETEIRLGYTLKKKGKGSADFYLYYNMDNRDGDAESSDAFGQGIMFKMLTAKKDLLVFGAETIFREFDSMNPYFDKTRNDMGYRLFATYTFNNVFGSKGKFISLTGFHAASVSNISFFDSNSSGGLVTAGFRF